MEVPLHFLSVSNSSEVVTGLNPETWGEKKKKKRGTLHLYKAYYVLCFLIYIFYTMEDKISRVNVIFSCPSLLSFRFHIIFYHDA